jgi:hypothetical protein
LDAKKIALVKRRDALIEEGAARRAAITEECMTEKDDSTRVVDGVGPCPSKDEQRRPPNVVKVRLTESNGSTAGTSNGRQIQSRRSELRQAALTEIEAAHLDLHWLCGALFYCRLYL